MRLKFVRGVEALHERRNRVARLEGDPWYNVNVALFHTTRSDRREECAIDYFRHGERGRLSKFGVQTRKLQGNNIIYHRRCKDHCAIIE